MNLDKLLISPAADALGWTLLHAVWQGFTIVLPTAAALHLLRNRSSAFRYRIGILSLCAQLLASVITFSYYYEATTPVPGINSSQWLAPTWHQDSFVIPWHQQVRQFLEGHLSQFVLVYLIGLLVFGFRLAGGWLYLQRLSRFATPPANALWNTVVNQLRTTMALQSVVQIRESASIAVPIVVGIIKPVLLIPIGLATSLSAQEIEAVLAHELAHVKRQDYAINLLQSLVDVLYFFHPALWWLSARVREERELCCDDLAVQACGGDGRRLAQALARIEELRLPQANSTPALAMAFVKKRLQLLHRVRRILGVPTRSIVSNRSLAGLTLITVLLLSASVYAIQQQQPKPKVSRIGTDTKASTPKGSTELYFDDKRNIKYVTWRGRKLPASRVASLQRLWDRVMSGQLNLDDVNQPDRDILLSIIESDSALETRRLQRIADDAQKTISSSIADTPIPNVEVWNSVLVDGKWTSPTRDTSADFAHQDTSRLAVIQRQLESLSNQMQKIMAQQQPVLDRVSKEMAELGVRHQELAKQPTPAHNSQLKQNQKMQELAQLQARLIMEKALEITNNAIELESTMRTTANATIKPSTPRKPTAPTYHVIEGKVVNPTVTVPNGKAKRLISPSRPQPAKPATPQKPE
jgi:beta-lactamase regulating signal transducer with metallopeptidase domain